MLVECLQHVASDLMEQIVRSLSDPNTASFGGSIAALLTIVIALHGLGFGGKAGAMLIRWVIVLALIAWIMYIARSPIVTLDRTKAEMTRCIENIMKPLHPTASFEFDSEEAVRLI